MRLAILQDIDVEKRSNMKIEYDLPTYKERLSNIAYEYYLGNKYKLKGKLFKILTSKQYLLKLLRVKVTVRVEDAELKKLLKESFEYAFNMLEREIKTKTITGV